MAGIGFELRKLFREQGLINHLKAYAYSSITTVGPMLISMLLILALQQMMTANAASSYQDWELYIATVAYTFIFSIVITSGFTTVLTRYVADMIYEHHYDRLMSSYYGALIVMLPLTAGIASLFLSQVNTGWPYHLLAYVFFLLMSIVWIQGVYLSALKDYVRIVRSYLIGAVLTLVSGWVSFHILQIEPILAALTALNIGFFIIVCLSSYHFEQRFPKANMRQYFDYLHYFKKYPSLWFAGLFVYSGVYLHNFVYWLSDGATVVADQFRIMPFYDLPVFFAFLSVMPSLVTFVISVETSFYTKFRIYYLYVMNGGTIRDINAAKQQMQRTLTKELSKLLEIQLLFTIMAIALGLKFLPRIGMTMIQLDLFMILCLAYLLFIMYFIVTHILMYFDDRKGVFGIGLVFFVMNIAFTYLTMSLEYDGLGMFIASFITLVLALWRLKYVLKHIDYFTFCSQPINQTQESHRSAKKNRFLPLTSLIIVSMLWLTACSELVQMETEAKSNEYKNRAAIPEHIDTTLVEDKRLYERDDPSSLKTLYITVLPSEKDDFDWYALNRQTDPDQARTLPVIVQEGYSDGDGPRSGMFGYGATKANATIEIRGNSTWYASQKSYGVRLKPDAGMFMDQRKLNLNKHVADLSRIRNKLSFDIMATIPNMTSLRTQFVHVYVKDLSQGETDAPYEDLGLFTHVEQPNKQFLRAHLLDPNGHVYKAIDFEYFLAEELKHQEDPDYDEAEFEKILGIRGNKDHTKLLAMLEDVNNLGIPIEETIAKHFDEENFLTWTAVNILIDNIDTMSQNFYLYSPLNSNTWYLLPWDYDYAFQRARNRHPFQHGISTYWGNVIHSRYFRNEANVEKLLDKIEELQVYINEDVIRERISQYRDVVEPFLYRLPDRHFLPGPASDFDEDLKKIIDTPRMSMERLMHDLERPKPFYIHDVEFHESYFRFSWGISYDFQDDKLFYELTVAKDPGMVDVIFKASDLLTTFYDAEPLPAGTYYMKVTVKDEHGNEQYAFDFINDRENNVYHFGTKEFEVE